MMQIPASSEKKATESAEARIDGVGEDHFGPVPFTRPIGDLQFM